ncbi:MAG: hypothetical protein EOP84_19025, partial [Verrucomicrobiaceae bacterium]
SMLEIGADAPVAVCVDRSVEAAVALLGILKAGAAYLPLDPDTPEALLVRIIRESCSRVLLTVQGATCNLSSYIREVGDLGAELELPMIYLDAEVWDGMTCEEYGRPLSCPGPENLACILYAEDSNSYLKGVQFSHRALANILLSRRERPGMSGADTLLTTGDIASGSGLLEILLPLSVGARTVIASDTALSSSLQLRRLCEEIQPTVLTASHAVLRSLIDAGWNGHDTLKVLSGNDEPWPEDLSESLLKRCALLGSMYGVLLHTLPEYRSLTKVVTAATFAVEAGRLRDRSGRSAPERQQSVRLTVLHHEQEHTPREFREVTHGTARKELRGDVPFEEEHPAQVSHRQQRLRDATGRDDPMLNVLRNTTSRLIDLRKSEEGMITITREHDEHGCRGILLFQRSAETETGI